MGDQRATRQFMEMRLNGRCSILFHFEVPGGKWHTVTCRTVSAASRPKAPPADPSCRPAFAGLGRRGDLLDGPTRDHRLRLALDRLAPGVGLLVVHLDQQPAPAAALPDAGQGIAAAELAALQP